MGKQYRNRLPQDWQPVVRGDMHHDTRDMIDVWPYGLYDTETDTLRTDPVEILNKMGIKVERYQKEPRRLEVLPEILRAAGVPLREFILE
jgi:hypothetical protein